MEGTERTAGRWVVGWARLIVAVGMKRVFLQLLEETFPVLVLLLLLKAVAVKRRIPRRRRRSSGELRPPRRQLAPS